MTQSKKQSIKETVTNTGIGFLGSLLIVWGVMKLIPNVELASITITSACTVWSIVRGYVIRRYFNNTESEK